MSTTFEVTEQIDSRDVDGLGRCKASALLGHMQQAAVLAAEDGGFGRESLLEEYGAVWMLARMWFALKRPLKFEEELKIQTWHRGGKGALMYRDYDLSVDGVSVGEGVSAWVVVSEKESKILRLSSIRQLEGTGGGVLCKKITLPKLRLPEDLSTVENRLMHYSDTDINGHVNNTRYADFACDVLREEFVREERFLAQMQIGYLAQCLPGEILNIQRGREEERHLIHGVDDLGKSRFNVAVNFGELIH